jgi:hypothetical protein
VGIGFTVIAIGKFDPVGFTEGWYSGSQCFASRGFNILDFACIKLNLG